MAPRPAPPAAHPPPAPDWILGPDGHWKPPPFSADGSPTTAPRRAATAADDDAPDETASTRSSPGAGVVFAVILVVLAIAYLAWISLGLL